MNDHEHNLLITIWKDTKTHNSIPIQWDKRHWNTQINSNTKTYTFITYSYLPTHDTTDSYRPPQTRTHSYRPRQTHVYEYIQKQTKTDKRTPIDSQRLTRGRKRLTKTPTDWLGSRHAQRPKHTIQFQQRQAHSQFLRTNTRIPTHADSYKHIQSPTDRYR